MSLRKNKNLKEYNSFGVSFRADYFLEVNTEDQLIEILQDKKFIKMRKLLIGDGFNILFVGDYRGLIIHMNIKGREVEELENGKVKVTLGAGEDWDKVVRWLVKQNYGGVENLVMVPGTVGGAASQNIACYGQNFSEVVTRVVGVNMLTGQKFEFSKEECEYQYRTSIFKRNPREYAITQVIIELEKDPKEFELDYHERKGRYGSIVDALEKVAVSPYSIEDVMNSIIYMRERRLPNTDEYGTCGCFFKNPVVSVEKYKELSEEIDDLQSYPADKLSYRIKDWDKVDGREYVKIPAGRILDELGYLDHWEGNVGISSTHALCVVTNRKASGKDILKFTENIKEKVKDKYGLDLEEEVKIVNSDA
jgi:UDP-N-acetylmuramate dehydrogenase